LLYAGFLKGIYWMRICDSAWAGIMAVSIIFIAKTLTHPQKQVLHHEKK